MPQSLIVFFHFDFNKIIQLNLCCIFFYGVPVFIDFICTREFFISFARTHHFHLLEIKADFI